MELAPLFPKPGEASSLPTPLFLSFCLRTLPVRHVGTKVQSLMAKLDSLNVLLKARPVDRRDGSLFKSTLQRNRVWFSGWTHLTAHNYVGLQFQRVRCLLVASVGTRHVHAAQAYMRSKSLHA